MRGEARPFELTFSSELGIDAELRKEYDNLEKTRATVTQEISEVNTELRNVTGYRRRALAQTYSPE